MMETQDQNVEPTAPEAPTATLGDTLRQTREQQGLSVEDVSNQIKFAPRQIEALEANDFGPTTDAAFLRGFVRSYAKLLHLDAEAMLALLPRTKVATLTAEPEPQRMMFPNAQTARRQQNMIWMGGALLAIVIALGFAISNHKLSDQSASQESVETPVTIPGAPEPQAASAVAQVEPVAAPVMNVAPAPEPVVEKPKAQTPAPVIDKPATRSQPKPVISTAPVPVTNKPVEVAPPSPAAAPAVAELPADKPIPIDMLLGLNRPPVKTEAPQVEAPTASIPAANAATLRIVFGEASWVEIKDKSGKVLSSQSHPAGSELNLNIGHAAPYDLAIGHAKSARLYYKGKQIELAPYIKKYSAVAHVTLE